MHAARAAARSSLWRPLTSNLWSANSATRLLTSRSLSTSDPTHKAKAGGKDSTADAPLAARLKQKRSRNETTGERNAADGTTSTAYRPDVGPAAGPRSPSKPAAPHKLRVPNAKPADQAIDPIVTALKGSGSTTKGKQRKRSASVEGFRAKRHAMQRMRREMTQAVQEAHGDAWLANEHKSPYELGTERYIRLQSHLPVKDQLRLFRARLSLIESLQKPWLSLGKQERQFELAEYAKQVRANEKRKRATQKSEHAGDERDGTESVTETQNTEAKESQDFDAMVDEHVKALAQASSEASASATTAPAQSAGDAADASIAADRQRTWPDEMEQMMAAISLLKAQLKSLTERQAQEGNAPSPPRVRTRDGPSLLDQIAETVTSNSESKTKGRTPRGSAGRAVPSSDTYEDHPALAKNDDKSGDFPPRELSSYQHVLSPASTAFDPHPSPYDVPVATLAHSLDRVLFNPGVHFLRDPRSGVYNFARDTLENVPKISEFDFSKLPQYVTSSKDETLKEIAARENKAFSGSTSSTVGMLCQIYFWLSKGKPVNLDMLSRGWQYMSRDFSMGQKLPVSVILRYENGRYAIDADKSFDPTNGSNILADYGHLMEKLLTTEASEFKRFLHGAEDPAPSEADHRQAYHYSLTDRMVLRSQLDATNEYLPNKTFDLKTRGTVAIRQDRLNYEESAGYTIDRLQGEWESFEREYYDLIRSAFLKYQFQARIGGMDGIFVAYHSTTRFFGFQYLPISVMDEALFGTTETGSQVFRLALGTLERVLDEAAQCYPGESVNVTWAADQKEDVLRVFVAPQKEVEKVETPSPASPDTSEGEARSELSHSDIEMTLLELRGTNYVDGEAQARPVTVSADRGPPGSDSPVWQVGFDIVKSTGAEGDAVTREQIASHFADTRAFQRMFSSLALPTGISPADVQAAAERAQEAGVELDESDLSVRFPLGEGIEYRGPSKSVKILRRKAREGEERRHAEEKRRLDAGGGKETVVEVKSYLQVREE